MVRGQRIDRLHVESAIGEVQRHAVLKHANAAAVKRALHARAADRNARLVRAETRLRDHAGREREGVCHRAGTATQVAVRLDDFRGTRSFRQFLAALGGGGHGLGNVFLTGLDDERFE